MMRSIFTHLAVAAVAWCLVAHHATASTLEIQFEGLDLIYDGTKIYDATDSAGGTGDPTKADPLVNVSFLVNGTLVHTLSSDIWADVLISGVSTIPIGGGFGVVAAQGDTFGFHLLTQNANPGFGLELNLDDDIAVMYAGNIIRVIAGGATVSSVGTQLLPLGLAFDDLETITIAFSSAHMTGLTDNGVFLTGFNASGTGNVVGTLVPEPSTILMGSLAALGVVVARRRRLRG